MLNDRENKIPLKQIKISYIMNNNDAEAGMTCENASVWSTREGLAVEQEAAEAKSSFT